MRPSPQMARRALTLAGDLEESLYSRWPDFHIKVTANMGGYSPSTIHGGGGRGGQPSDPTGEQAINPESDLARHKLVLAYATLRRAAAQFATIGAALSNAIGDPPVQAPIVYRHTLSTRFEGRQALDHLGYLIEHLDTGWETYHRLRLKTAFHRNDNGCGCESCWAYASLDAGVDVLVAVDSIVVEFLGPDLKRVYCANALGCPDRAPPAPRSRRCWACDKHFRRTRDRGLGPGGCGEERTRAAERAADGFPAVGEPPADEPTPAIQGAA